jgi:hypothetical protein
MESTNHNARELGQWPTVRDVREIEVVEPETL